MGFVDKLAKKSFESVTIQNSWKMHVEAFGPILLPAFVDDYKSKVHLCSALNLISNGKIEQGIKKIEDLHDACVTDADKTCLLFCVGLAYDLVRFKEGMLEYYQAANDYEHDFYLPYLKVAKAAHEDAIFEAACMNYLNAITCFENKNLSDKEKKILSSIYMNLCSALTMMHEYDKAQEALNKGKELYSHLPNSEATEIVLKACLNDVNAVNALLQQMKANNSPIYEYTEQFVKKILDKTHPQFSIVEIEVDKIEQFWIWFINKENDFINYNLKNDKYEEMLSEIQQQLQLVFPFMERTLDIAMEKEDKIHITFVDFYCVALTNGYEQLIKNVPDQLKEKWSFEVTH